MKERVMCIMLMLQICFAHGNLLAQTSDTIIGIKWTTGLSWQEVKQKAKQENKYIFLDCFTTWCGPCKQMEQGVFTKKNLGDFINEKFIAVRVQMDKTKNDNDQVKDWYGDVAAIHKNYKITAYPTFLFFRPDGSIVYRERGFKISTKFIAIAQEASKPGRKYEDPYAEYDRFVADYQLGKRNYSQMPLMTKKAREVHDRSLVAALSKDYFNYLSKSNKKIWYTKSNVEFIATNITSSKSKFFSMFYPDGRNVNKATGKKELARYTVLRIINNEIMKPYLDSFSRHFTKEMAQAGFEPSWDSIANLITQIYNSEFAVRAIRIGKHDFYWITGNKAAYFKNLVERIKNDDIDPDDPLYTAFIDFAGELAMEFSSDEGDIKMITGWLREYVNSNSLGDDRHDFRDTYANLLYKSAVLFHTNTIEEAISWEKKALQDAIDSEQLEELKNHYKQSVDKMIARQPIW